MNTKRLLLMALVCLMVFTTFTQAAAAISLNYLQAVYELERTEAYKQFKKQFPKAKMTKKERLGSENHVFLQNQLVNQSRAIDVFQTDVVDNSLTAILQKGYYVPLQEDADIRGYIMALPPQIREAVMVGEDISCLPVHTHFPYVLLLNPELLERVGLARGSLPRTFIELIDFALAWPEKYGNEHPEITPLYIAGGSVHLSLRNYAASYVLEAYLYSMIASGEPVRFDTPLFRSLLTAIAPLTRNADMELRQEDYMGDPPQWHQCLFYIIWGTPFYTPRMEVMAPLPLADGLPVVQPVSLVKAHLNPHSKSVKDAKIWLSFQARYPEPGTARLLGLVDSPLEFQGINQKNPPQAEADRYRISPTQITHYRERVLPHLYVVGQSGVEAPGFLNQAQELFIQYLDGALPEELFIQQLDNIIKLIGAEGM